MKKRITALILAFCMILSAVPISVGAAGTQGITANSVTVTAGNSVSVTLSAEGFTNIASLEVYVYYDPEVLTLNSTSNGSLLSGSQTSVNTHEAGTVKLATMALSGISGSGKLLTLNFSTQADCEPGTYPITVAVGQVCDTSLQEVTISSTNGAVTVNKPVVTETFYLYGSPNSTNLSQGDMLTYQVRNSWSRTFVSGEFIFTYDHELFRFDSAELASGLTGEGALYSVNSSVLGQVRIAYVNDNPVSSNNLFTVNLKAIADTDTTTTVKAQATNMYREDLTAFLPGECSTTLTLQKKPEVVDYPNAFLQTENLVVGQQSKSSFCLEAGAGVAAADFTLTYDPAILRCVSVKASDTVASKGGMVVVNNKFTDGSIRFSYVNMDAYDEETFPVVEILWEPIQSPQEHYEVLISGVGVVDPQQNAIELEYVKGTGCIYAITVTEPTCTEKGVKRYTCASCGDFYTEDISPTGHDIQSVEAKVATCNETGYIAHYACKTCGMLFMDADGNEEATIEEVTTQALGHSFTKYVSNKDATCTEDGTKTATCDRCAATDTITDEDSKLGHTLQKTEAKAATCTEAGNSEYYTCTVCGKYFSDGACANEIAQGSWVISATGHSLTKTEAKVATCTENGSREYYSCSICEKFFSDKDCTTEIEKNSWVIPAKGHSLIKTEAKDATCTESGHNAYWTCENCDMVFRDASGTEETNIDALTIPATGHTSVAVPGKDATCTETGLTDGSQCSVCGVILNVQDTVPALGHSFTTYVSDGNATCMEDGTKTAKCDRCDASDTITDIDSKLGHSLQKTEAKAATCTDAGNSKYYTCDRCGKYFSDENGTTEIQKDSWKISATGHSPELVPGYAATCTETGLTDGSKCSVCGETLGAQVETPVLGHMLVLNEAAEPTCEGEGNIEYYICSRCSNCFTDEAGENEIDFSDCIILPNGHCLVDIPGQEATCTETGLTEGSKCSVCGEIFSEQEVIPALGHTSDWVAPKEPTCTEPGNTGYYRCIACGLYFADEDCKNEITEEDWLIPAKGHNLHKTEAKDATCTESGHNAYWTCENCSMVFRDASGTEVTSIDALTIPATGHTVETVPGKPATCTETGLTEGSKCSVCGEILVAQTETPALGHSFTNYVSDNNASCTSDGTKTAVCDRVGCDEKDTVTDIGSMLGHSWSDAWTSNATSHWHVCAVCGEKNDEAKHISSGQATETEAETCTVCGYVIAPALGHIHTNHLTSVVAKDATCTEAGNQAYYVCECGTWFVDADALHEITDHSSVVIPAKGHTSEAVPGKPATCTETGLTEGSKCSVCGEILVAQTETPALGHSFTNYVSDNNASCTSDGTKTAVCDRVGCDEKDTVTDIGSMLGHSWSDAWTSNATSHWHVCAVCGEKNDEAKHISSGQATETEAETCTVCGYVIAPALGHIHTNHLTPVVAKDATCTEAGNQAYYVCECGTWFADADALHEITDHSSVVIPAKGHTPVAVPEKPATCTETGLTEGSKCSVCGEILVAQTETPALGHSFTNYVSDNNASCTSDGTKTAVCDRVGCDEKDTVTDIGSMLGHSWSDAWTSNATSHWHVCAVCGEKNDEAKHISSGQATETEAETCTVCGYVIAPALGHIHTNHLTPVVAKTATCTEAGNQAYYVCECGTWFADADALHEITDHSSVMIPAKGHISEAVPGKPATCTETGLTEGSKCSVCGEILVSQTEIPALGHSFTKYVSDGNATCTKDGTKTAACDRVGCDEKDTVTDIGSMLGHSLKYTTANAATCTKDGNSAYYTCTTCGKYFSDEACSNEIEKDSWLMPAAGHQWNTEWTSDADSHWHACAVCGEKNDEAKHISSGQTTETEAETCTVCGYVIAPALGHIHTNHLTPVVAKDATCTEEGNYSYYTCDCGMWFADADALHEITDHSSVVIPAKGHTPVAVPEKPATCTETGLTEGSKCSVCGEILVQQTEIPALGHSFTNYVSDRNATCTKDGTKTAVCDRIGCDEKDTVTDIGSMLGHSWSDAWTSNATSHWHVCAVCGEKNDEAKHISSGQATETEAETCTVCGYVIAPALGHIHTNHLTPVVAKDATCTETGNQAYYVCDCGMWFVDADALHEITDHSSVVIPAKGHTSEAVPGKPATCTETGLTEGSKCSVCGEILVAQVIIPAIGHTSVAVPGKPATCTEKGLTEGSKCAICGVTLIAQNTVPALGHSFTIYKYNNDAKVGVDGTETAVCDRAGCGATDTRTAKGTALPAPPVSFIDVKPGAYYESAVNWAVANDITKGMTATTFAPEASCTRGQVVTFLWRAAGKPEPKSGNNPFTDVKEKAFYYKAVLWAAENGITAGTSATTFSPDAACTRGQVVTFLWRASGEPAPKTQQNPFTDVKEKNFFYKAVLWASESGVTAGTSKTTFSPQKTCTRGQIVTFLYRAYG